MRRRLWVAIVGTVATALLLAGLGTFALARVDDRRAQLEDLGDQADALAEVLASVPVLAGTDRPAVRERLARIQQSFDLHGIGVVVRNLRGTVILEELPDGVEPDDLGAAELGTGEPVTWTDDGLLVGAAASRGTTLDVVVVVTDTPRGDVGRAAGWFLLSAAGTLLLGMLVAARLGRTLAEPVAEAQNATHRIAAGDLAARVPDTIAGRDDELGGLARSINTMAETLERSRGLERQFLMSVSHDLRTPMTSIRGYAEALADGAIDDPGRAGAVILAEARRLERLVSDLLLLARLDARSFPLEIRTTELTGLLEDVVAGFAPSAGEDGLRLDLETVPVGLRVRADADRLSQVLANLLENAGRFARSRITVAATGGDDRVHIAVRDDGPGIDPVDLPFVFERLYVARHRPVARESGSGLGLAIVKELTEAMGGTVTARSVPGQGTELVVTLLRA